MTSNQLSYWRNQEEIRSNKAKEAETKRANLEREALTRVDQKLKEQEIEIKDKQVLSQLAELYMDRGMVEWGQLPTDLQEKLNQEYHLSSLSDNDTVENWWTKLITGVSHEFKDLWKSGGSKIIAALF